MGVASEFIQYDKGLITCGFIHTSVSTLVNGLKLYKIDNITDEPPHVV